MKGGGGYVGKECVGDVYEGGGGICRWRHSGVGVGVA